MKRFCLGVMLGSLAYPVGVEIGAWLTGRNDRDRAYAFGVRA